jgi:AraC-like DNA-binding protein
MTSGALLRPRLLLALNRAIGWSKESGVARILLAQPPIHRSSQVEVTLHSGRPLSEKKPTKIGQPYFCLNSWKRQRLHSIRFPYLACLLEGEMDWRIGITQSMAKSLPEPESQCSHLALHLRAGQFFLMPPGVPYSDGRSIHWSGAQPETASYKILWLHLLPTGAFCHLSGARRGVLFYEPPLYVHDARIHLLTEFLMEELQNRAAQFEAVAHDQLHSILLRIRRGLEEQPPFVIENQQWRNESAQQDVRAILADGKATAVQRACAYIETHLHDTLQLDTVARQAFVSPSHLNRLFSRELGMPAMQYVLHRRIEIAQALLIHSQLPVHEIGRQVGYPNPSHFSQIFTHKVRQTPQGYRKNPATSPAKNLPAPE